MGQAAQGQRSFRSGFLGRLSETLVGTRAADSAISFTDSLPLVFTGGTTVPNLSLKNVGKPPFDERQSRILSDMYAGHHLEGAAQGRLAGNLASLGTGLQVFSQSLGAEWSNTVVVVLSEFGRTFRENGSRGTDHGHGTVYWVLGGSMNGGAVLGAQQRVARSTLFQDRDFPVLSDYRAVLGGLFRSMWALNPSQSAHIFEQTAPVDLKLV